MDGKFWTKKMARNLTLRAIFTITFFTFLSSVQSHSQAYSTDA